MQSGTPQAAVGLCVVALSGLRLIPWGSEGRRGVGGGGGGVCYFLVVVHSSCRPSSEVHFESKGA